MNEALEHLLQEPAIWRAGDSGQPRPGHIPSGFAELDAALPGGGWPDSALTELLHAPHGIGELRLFMPALARLSRSGRWIALIAPPHIPYAPALAAQGVDLSRILLVHPRRHQDTLWAAEQALRSGTCAAVLAWPGSGTPARQFRRLQLAAEAGRSWGILFRGHDCTQEASPSALRVVLHAETPEDGNARLELLKCRGGLIRHSVQLDLDRPRTRALPVKPTTPVVANGATGWQQRRPRPDNRPRPEPQPQLPLPLGRSGTTRGGASPGLRLVHHRHVES
ncbi:MAG: translesion DNA synthesis-associated protein ImuA [Ectothiorhodospiraceae bacterium]|nr:translesion DNA synthesis-associated protein ImuA [Ectothiorhodospiraceae bacterium]